MAVDTKAPTELEPVPDSDTPKEVRRLVLDSGAFISGNENLFAGGGLRQINSTSPLLNTPLLSEEPFIELYTVLEVVNEIRDNQAKRRLKLLQDKLKVQTPSAEAIAKIVEFAKATGDFAALSLADIKVLALTYMMEVEKNGTEFVKEVPVKPKFGKQRLMTLEEYDEWEKRREEEIRKGKNERNKGFADGKGSEEREGEEDERPNDDDEGDWVSMKPKSRTVNRELEKKRAKNRRRLLRRREKRKAEKAALEIDRENVATAGQDIGKTCEPSMEAPNGQSEESKDVSDAETDQTTTAQTEEALAPGDTVDFVGESGRAGEDTTWISEENIEEHLARDRLGSLEVDDEVNRVGCVTNDFAMQNVLLQMGLKLLSVDGKSVVKKVRRYILRCEACNAQTQEAERKFCPRCGNATLFRAAYTIDRKGIARVHLNAKHKPRLRGTKYSIPLPRGGRSNKDLILREDQIDMQKLRRAVRSKERAVRDVLDPNATYNAGARYDPIKPVVIGYGRRNPNEARRRRKGKKK